MKKITAIIKGVSESVKASYKEKRILKALEVAKINAEEDLEVAKQELATFDASDKDADSIILSLSDLLEKVEDAKYTLEHLTKIEAYLAEDVQEGEGEGEGEEGYSDK